jgi:hypothetical protein
MSYGQAKNYIIYPLEKMKLRIAVAKSTGERTTRIIKKEDSGNSKRELTPPFKHLTKHVFLKETLRGLGDFDLCVVQ